MYKIIGNDGKTYGPVPAEKIREWIAHGRVDSRTAVFMDGAADWTFLGLLPAFARDFSGLPPVMTTSGLPMRNTNGFATAGLVCGLLAWVCCCGCPFNILGLIFSIIALVQINGQLQKQAGWGLALAGLICSAVNLLFDFGLGMLQLALHPAHVSWRMGSM